MSARREEVRVNRREFIVMGIGVAGSLVVGLPAIASVEGDRERMIGFFVQIDADLAGQSTDGGPRRRDFTGAL